MAEDQGESQDHALTITAVTSGQTHAPGPQEFPKLRDLLLGLSVEKGGSITFFKSQCGPLAEEIRSALTQREVLLEALRLAEAALAGANMNMTVVKRKVRAAIASATGGSNAR